MKLCIENNALRLRLSAAEVQAFSTQGLIKCTVPLSAEPLNHLIYALERRPDISQIDLEYNGSQITVLVPLAVADAWTGTAQIGFSATKPLPDGRELHILVEKDLGHH